MLAIVIACACAALPGWPSPCPDALHYSEARYIIARQQYCSLVSNFTTTRQNEYNAALQQYRKTLPEYERNVRAVDSRFWQMLVLRGVITKQPRHQQSWSVHELGEHDETLYWHAIDALGPKPVAPIVQPYHVLDIVGVDLVAILTAHLRLITVWQTDVFTKKLAQIVFGNLQVVFDAHTLTATRDAFKFIGQCNRAPIPSRLQFEELYNATQLSS